MPAMLDFVKKMVVRGVEVNVVGDDETARIARQTDGVVLHVCIRVADMHEKPYPALAARRRRILCEMCREPIWFDPLSVPKGLIAISRCIQCMTGPFGFVVR